MGPLIDECGVEQDGINSSELYKVHNNEQLNTAQLSGFGVEIGPVVVSSIGQADDVVLLSNCPYTLQGLIDLTEYYCSKYNVILTPEKTNLQVYLSKNVNSPDFSSKSLSSLKIAWEPLKFTEEAERFSLN